MGNSTGAQKRANKESSKNVNIPTYTVPLDGETRAALARLQSNIQNNRTPNDLSLNESDTPTTPKPGIMINELYIPIYPSVVDDVKSDATLAYSASISDNISDFSTLTTFTPSFLSKLTSTTTDNTTPKGNNNNNDANIDVKLNNFYNTIKLDPKYLPPLKMEGMNVDEYKDEINRLQPLLEQSTTNEISISNEVIPSFGDDPLFDESTSESETQNENIIDYKRKFNELPIDYLMNKNCFTLNENIEVSPKDFDSKNKHSQFLKKPLKKYKKSMYIYICLLCECFHIFPYIINI